MTTESFIRSIKNSVDCCGHEMPEQKKQENVHLVYCFRMSGGLTFALDFDKSIDWYLEECTPKKTQ